MDARQRSLVLLEWSYLAAVAAGVNFYWLVDDTQVVAAMRGHTSFGLSHQFVALGSFVAFAAVIAIALPAVLGILRTAFVERRGEVVARVSVPFVSAAIVTVWIALAATWAHGRWGGAWVPTPWDVNAAIQPIGWPPVRTRLILSSITFALLAIGWLASGVSVAQAIRRTDLSHYSDRWFRTIAILFAGSTLVMTIGILTWGWLAERYSPGVFHAGDGLLIDVSMARAWLASAVGFVLSATIAVAAARESRGIRV